MAALETPPYPSHWEADVVLRDGGTAHLRPIRPDDAERIQEFHGRLSPESIYFRFFAPYPRLTERDVARFTQVDYTDRVALIALIGDEMIGVVRYDRVDAREYGVTGRGTQLAEVAFVVRDDHQRRGLGSVLLEHIAQAARERGVTRFVADVLPQNRRMMAVFEEAGYQPAHTFEEGVVRLTFDVEPTETSIAVMQAREHRSEARSIQRLLHPGSVAVVGASRSQGTVGQALLRHLVDGGFTGSLYAVHPEAREVLGVPTYPSLIEIPGQVDLAVVASPAETVPRVVREAAVKGVHGLVVVSSGFAESGSSGRERQHELVRTARANGMRVIGPNCLGIVNTDSAVSLNASLAPTTPTRGHVGMFSQSGALGIAILELASERGLGLSTFVSAGNRADVSGNDLLQYWEDDPATHVVLLYLESIGNPRKFARLTRRIARKKPVVAVKTGRSTQGVPLGHAVRTSTAPAAAVRAMFRQSGVIRVDTVTELFDVAQLLAYQPLPQGLRVAILGNSDALGLLAADACVSAGLQVVGDPVALGSGATAADFSRALAGVLDDPAVDSVVAVFIPPLNTTGEEVAGVIAAGAARATKTVVTTFLACEGVPAQLRRLDEHGVASRGSVPSYGSPEEAVRALAAVTRYAEWRRRSPGTYPQLEDIDAAAGRRLVERALADAPDGQVLAIDPLVDLLGDYGVTLWPALPARSPDEAVAAARALGYPVALKTVAPGLRHRVDVGGVRLDVGTDGELRTAWQSMVARLGERSGDRLVVQRMAPAGVAVVVESTEDPLFGPIVSFSVGGVTSELLRDRSYRIPPLTDVDAAAMVREVGAAPLLLGYRGAEPVDVAALERLILRIARLTDDLPEIAHLELNPVIVAPQGLAVLGAEARLEHPAVRTDLSARRLTGL